MARTYVILDGLQDLELARQVSRRWAHEGFDNAVDPAAQAGWVARRDGVEMTEADIERAAVVARTVGVELRDRVGTTFVVANDAAALRERMAYEYKSRFATALVFGLPALGLHYGGAWLAGGADGARAMLYPWLFELLLVGWACVAAGWPVLWNAGLSLVYLRATADLLTMLIVVAALVPGTIGVVWIIATGDTWLGVWRAEGPQLHAALFAIAIVTLQRWMAYRYADRLSGRAALMVPRLGRLVAMWIVFCAAVMVWQGREMGLAIALLLPPMIGVGAINRLSPGWSMVLPVLGFAAMLLLAPDALQMPVRGIVVEIAAGFSLLMTGVFGMGWRGWGVKAGER